MFQIENLNGSYLLGMERKGIGIINLPNQRYRSFCQRGIQYNIMLVGGKGSGKSSFMNMILNNDILHMDPFTPEALSECKIEYRSPEHPYQIVQGIQMDPYEYTKTLVNFQITHAHFHDKRFNIKLSITEVDGVGDQINNEGCWEPILAHISDMNNDYLRQEQNTVKSKIDDKRIHLCLFFIESTSVPFKSLDNHVMHELSKVCNLIPVVSKSDFLTDNEAAEFYEKVKIHLEKEKIDFCDPRNMKLWQKINSDCPFFTVVGSRGSNFLKERQLSFGRIDIHSEEFKDLRILKKIIIDDHMLDLIDTTDYFYEMFRADHISSEIRSKSEYSDTEKELIANFMLEMKEQEKALEERKYALMARKKELESDIKELDVELNHFLDEAKSQKTTEI